MPDSGKETATWDMRGVMLDPARFTESYDYYHELIPDLAAWGFDTLMLHLTDDQGCAVRLDEPRVLPTAGALTPEQWRALVSLAEQHGLTVIPEVEALGHTGCLTRLPENEDLREPPSVEGRFWSISPTDPRSVDLLGELIAAIADIFPSQYLHIGMDEADIGGSPRSRKALETTPLWRLFGDHLLRIHSLVRDLGRRPIIWGDHLLKEPQLAEMLPRDILICNWLYGRGHTEAYGETTGFFLQRGYEVLACPAGCWWGTLYAPHGDNLANIRDYAQAARKAGSGVRGMLITMWSPYRHLPAVTRPIMRYAGAVTSGEAPPVRGLLENFAARRYGLEGTALELATDALVSLHTERERDLLEHALLHLDEDICRDRAQRIRAYHRTVAASADALRSARDRVLGHGDEYDQWLVSAETMQALAAYCLGWVEEGTTTGPDLVEAIDRFEEVWYTSRTHTGAQADEPQMGQAPRPFADHDALMARLAELHAGLSA
jgi:hypothetical protein